MEVVLYILCLIICVAGFFYGLWVIHNLFLETPRQLKRIADALERSGKMTCKDCYHFGVCYTESLCLPENEPCEFFKDKSTIVGLPCKVGEDVFAIECYGGKPLYIFKDKVQHICIARSNIHFRLQKHHPHNKTYQFNKLAFLTREEAEAALKAMEVAE